MGWKDFLTIDKKKSKLEKTIMKTCQEAAKNVKTIINRPFTSRNYDNTGFLNRSSASKSSNNKDEFFKRPSTSKC